MLLKNKLKIEAKNDLGTLVKAVVDDILDHGDSDEEITSYIEDILSHGCVSGTVSMLIYYRDTHKFYDDHYDDIEALRQDLEESMGEALSIEGDLKNYFAWFAFEETTRKLAEKIWIEAQHD